MSTRAFTFDPDLLQELERLYQAALKTRCKRFIFHGHEMATDYAKYLIEFLRGALPHA